METLLSTLLSSSCYHACWRSPSYMLWASSVTNSSTGRSLGLICRKSGSSNNSDLVVTLSHKMGSHREFILSTDVFCTLDINIEIGFK